MSATEELQQQIAEALEQEGRAKTPAEACFHWGKRVGLIAAVKKLEEA